jgi:hypothetical protein
MPWRCFRDFMVFEIRMVPKVICLGKVMAFEMTFFILTHFDAFFKTF